MLLVQQPPGLVLVTPPDAEPLTVAEARAQLRIDPDESDEDDLITALVIAAREWVEAVSGRVLVTQSWQMTRDQFPTSSIYAMVVPKPPLQSVTSITYVDTAGVVQTWDSTLYVVDAASAPGRIRPQYTRFYPITRYVMNGVTVKFDAGYGDASAVPQWAKQAMRLLVGHWYLTREPVVVGSTAAEVPFAVKALMAPHRVRW